MMIREWTRRYGACNVAGCLMLAAFGVIYVGLATLARSLFQCETTVFSQTPSPNGEVIAKVYQIDCGATTAFNRQVSLRTKPGWFGRTGETQVLDVRGEPSVKVKWLSPNHIAIQVRNGEATYYKAAGWNGVTITYE